MRALLLIALACCTAEQTTQPQTLGHAPDAPVLSVTATSQGVCMTATEYQRELDWKAAIRAWVVTAEMELGIAP